MTVDAGIDQFVFNEFTRQGPRSGLYEVYTQDDTPGGSFILTLDLPVPSLAGYQGSSICSVLQPCSSNSFFDDRGLRYDFTTGSVVSQVPLTGATPEPSSLALLGTGLLGMVGMVKRRLA